MTKKWYNSGFGNGIKSRKGHREEHKLKCTLDLKC